MYNDNPNITEIWNTVIKCNILKLKKEYLRVLYENYHIIWGPLFCQYLYWTSQRVFNLKWMKLSIFIVITISILYLQVMSWVKVIVMS